MGYITVDSLNQFLDEFFHELHTSNYKIAIISPDPPDSIKSILRKNEYYHRLYYFTGDPLHKSELDRVSLETADACFILNDLFIEDVEEADRAVVLHCLSVKSFKKSLPVFVELHKPESKVLLHRAGLCNVICINEIKSGILARSIFTPGFSTLINDLMRSNQLESTRGSIAETARGSCMQIYNIPIPRALYKMSFYEAVATVYTKKNAILIGFQCQDKKIILNPGKDYVISGEEIGFFISQDMPNITSLDETTTTDANPTEVVDRVPLVEEVRPIYKSPKNKNCHTVKPRTLEEGTSAPPPSQLDDHIVLIGFLRESLNLIKTLRHLNINKVKTIVVLSPRLPNQEEWDEISVFDQVYIVSGSPFRDSDLKRVGIKHAFRVVILHSFERKKFQTGNFTILDKNPILTYLKITHKTKSSSILLELGHRKSLGVLHKSTNWLSFPEYTQGIAFNVSLLHTMLAQSFYNTSLLSLLERLIGFDTFNGQRQMLPNAIELVDVPEKFHGKRFEDLFVEILKNNVIPLALYRGPQLEGHSYVYSNPLRESTITDEDKVFVLKCELKE
eukprot:TRINITY_DN4758_c0_g1_i2.p1 TRINITY_DN4758_c0_g1~~TRINITY_DN4758_c0_g1_i2.p1  ORF type:complete len:562 (+),score=123.99 TRINITY_DN4758_c0_g1_i2:1038-2723(+)